MSPLTDVPRRAAVLARLIRRFYPQLHAQDEATRQAVIAALAALPPQEWAVLARLERAVARAEVQED